MRRLALRPVVPHVVAHALGRMLLLLVVTALGFYAVTLVIASVARECP